MSQTCRARVKYDNDNTYGGFFLSDISWSRAI